MKFSRCHSAAFIPSKCHLVIFFRVFTTDSTQEQGFMYHIQQLSTADVDPQCDLL